MPGANLKSPRSSPHYFCEETLMFIFNSLRTNLLHPVECRIQISVAVALVLFSGFAALAQSTTKQPAKSKGGTPEIKEELIFKNGDRLTGLLLNSTGEVI